MRPTLIWLLMFLTTWVTAFAQPGDPPADPGDPVPLSGLGILLAAGAALGIKKLLKKEKH